MKGHGRSYGAISVLNAIPCGIGATIGVELTTDVYFSESDTTEVTLIDRPNMSPDLVKSCVKATLEHIGQDSIDYSIEVRTDIPPSVGLKSSSSVCNATIKAVLDAFGESMDEIELIRLGVRCARECKVTITGSFDDACGCGLGGLVVTDNLNDDVLSRDEVPKYDVVICVPERTIPKSKVPRERYAELSDVYRSMASRIRTDYLNIITENGRYVGGIIGDVPEFVESALDAGALAAGISGTGPSMTILTEKGKGKEIADKISPYRYILTETR